MSWKLAPLYVRVFDLTKWMHEHTRSFRDQGCAELGHEIDALQREMLTSIGLALTFPVTRSAHQRNADEGVIAIRLRLRLAHSLGLSKESSFRFATDELAVIGRMLGGWRRKWRIRRSLERRTEAKIEAATAASTVAAATGTMRTGSPRGTAGGTTRTTAGTTRDSGSASSPPHPATE